MMGRRSGVGPGADARVCAGCARVGSEGFTGRVEEGVDVAADAFADAWWGQLIACWKKDCRRSF